MTLNGAKLKDDTKSHALCMQLQREQKMPVQDLWRYLISVGAITASLLEVKGFSLFVLIGENKQGKRGGPTLFFLHGGELGIVSFSRLMAAYSEKGSLCEAVPGSKIVGATDRKNKKKTRGPTAWHRLYRNSVYGIICDDSCDDVSQLTTQISQAQ